MSDARAERRRQAREDRKRTRTLLVGDGIVAAATGHYFRADAAAAELPPKTPGRHRFVAWAAYVVTDAQAATAFDADHRHMLGPDQLLNLAIGCWDCELPLGVEGGITWDSRCPAPASD